MRDDIYVSEAYYRNWYAFQANVWSGQYAWRQWAEWETVRGF